MSEARLHEGDRVIVADGAKALILENIGDAERLLLEVVSTRAQDNPPTRQQGTDEPGRARDTGMGQRSAIAETDWHRLAKDRFAEDIAEILYKQAHRGRFRRLVIVAAPHVLGALRHRLHAEVAGKVIAEIPETLTNHPVDRIEHHVRDHLQQHERHFGPEKRPL